MHGLEKLIKSACKCLLSVSQALELEIHASNEFAFQINNKQLFRPFGYSSVVSSISGCVFLRYALCGKTVLERFQFRCFSGPFSRRRAVWPGTPRELRLRRMRRQARVQNAWLAMS